MLSRRRPVQSIPSAAVALAAALAASTLSAEEPEFAPRRVARPFPPITDAPFRRAADVTDQVLPNELVLGVVVEGVPRAYPINMLTGPRREIINDRIGDTAFAATW